MLIKSSRAKSAAAGLYASTNLDNLEVAKSFLEYDVDDGRSSKLCQNEDDADYYGQLEIEYKSKGKLYNLKTLFSNIIKN